MIMIVLLICKFLLLSSTSAFLALVFPISLKYKGKLHAASWVLSWAAWATLLPTVTRKGTSLG